MAPSFGEWLTTQPIYSVLVKIDSEFYNDQFNLYGLKTEVKDFKNSLYIIKRSKFKPDDYSRAEVRDAILLYGLIHKRFLETYDGCQKIKQKLEAKIYPRCPRYLCNGCSCIPYGLSEVVNESKLKFFCPNCQDVYEPPINAFNAIDGAFFGPTYVHLLKQKFRVTTPKGLPHPFVPRAYGFKIDYRKPKKIKKSKPDAIEQ